jgi:ketopantoate reductase
LAGPGRAAAAVGRPHGRDHAPSRRSGDRLRGARQLLAERPRPCEAHFGNGLIIGEPAGGSSPALEALLALLLKAGFEASASEQIQRDVWYKLWGNMTVNPVSALTGATTDLILDDPQVRDFISAVMREAKAIGERIGIPIDQEPEDRHQVTRKLGAFKTSMLQDVEARRSVELDALVGAVRELGQLCGRATPSPTRCWAWPGCRPRCGACTPLSAPPRAAPGTGRPASA